MNIRFYDRKYEISVWNKKYTYADSFFPSSVEIGGREILFSPMRLSAHFGDRILEWEKYTIIPFSESGESATFLISAKADNITMNADVTVEEDGFIKTNLRLIADWTTEWSGDNMGKKPRITGLSIDMPIKRKLADFMHFWPNCDSAVNLSKTILNSSAVPEDGISLPFKPYFWLGNDNLGLGISCESNEKFINTDEAKVYTLDSREDCVNLHISLLDSMPPDWDRPDEWGNNLPVIPFSFGIQATPVKEFDEENLKNWRPFHLYGVTNHPIYEAVKGDGSTLLEKIAASGANWLILHEAWSVLQNYGMPYDEADFKRFVGDCHRLGLKLMVYFGYEVSTLLPDFNNRHREMLAINTEGNTVGGWQRSPAQRDYTVCYAGSYSDIMIERVKYVMDELGVDGIYTDGTYVPWECANESHGCGYRDKNGKLHATYPIYAAREHVRKLYRAVHERGGIVDAHQSSCCLAATLAFADCYYDGENIQDMIIGDISTLKLDTFRAEFVGRNIGIPCNFVTHTTDKHPMRKTAAVTLIHGTLPRANKPSDLGFVSEVWKALDDYGIEGAEWVPYYAKDNKFTENGRGLYVSYYKKGNDLLLFAASLKEEADTLTVGGVKSYRDYLDGDSATILDKNTLTSPLGFASLKILRVWEE